MLRGWKIWSAVVGAVASLMILVAGTQEQNASEEGGGRWGLSIPGYEGFIPWQDKAESAEEGGVEAKVPEGSALWVRLVDKEGEGVEADALISAPGMWPFVSEAVGSGGYLGLPKNEVERFEGGQVYLYELLARSERGREEEVAFWGVIKGPEEEIGAELAKEIQLGPARSLEVEVVDESGAEVEGVFVRLSRESVGMLHLVMASDEEGRAEFSRIPEGVYFLTIDADGYARQTVRVEHSVGAKRAVKVVLEEGGSMRLPESWRGPLLAEMIPELEVEEEVEEGLARPEIELNIFAADSRGGGVEGAWIEVWSGQERVAQGLSGGRQALKFSVPVDSQLKVVATHAGWGEGSLVVEEGVDGGEVVVRMKGSLLGEALRDRVRGPQEIERILGAPLVADGKRWLVDRPAKPEENRAFERGLERGDSLLFLRREGGEYRAVVERRGQVVEVVF